MQGHEIAGVVGGAWVGAMSTNFPSALRAAPRHAMGGVAPHGAVTGPVGRKLVRLRNGAKVREAGRPREGDRRFDIDRTLSPETSDVMTPFDDP